MTSRGPQDRELVRRVMRSNRSKDTGPELALRRALHRRGVRYRLHASDVPGRPDIVIRKYRLAVFVDGDFWHGNRWRLRGLARLEDDFPSNTAFWADKIRANIARDERVSRTLAEAGWHFVRIWESEILRDPEDAADRVILAIREARRHTSMPHSGRRTTGL